MKRKLGILVLFIALNLAAASQVLISGKVTDSNTGKPVVAVNVFNPQNSSGTVTNDFGEFVIKMAKSDSVLVFSAIGYSVTTINVNPVGDAEKPLHILINEEPYSLSEITIRGGVTSNKNNPVSISQVDSKTITTELGDRPLPLVMQSTPGVFSVRNGGGSGDARLTIRGFQQEDLMLMLNGIPVSSEENGLVYWSNWLGLSYAASEIQIQKGVGLSNSSVYNIGGSINYITKKPEINQRTIFNAGVTSYGNYNVSLTLNSGLMKNGWNTTAMFSYETGSGYVDATKVKAMAYFFSANKKINEKQNITINLIGAPQRHDQRTLMLTNEEVEKYGINIIRTGEDLRVSKKMRP